MYEIEWNDFRNFLKQNYGSFYSEITSTEEMKSVKIKLFSI